MWHCRSSRVHNCTSISTTSSSRTISRASPLQNCATKPRLQAHGSGGVITATPSCDYQQQGESGSGSFSHRSYSKPAGPPGPQRESGPKVMWSGERAKKKENWARIGLTLHRLLATEQLHTHWHHACGELKRLHQDLINKSPCARDVHIYSDGTLSHSLPHELAGLQLRARHSNPSLLAWPPLLLSATGPAAGSGKLLALPPPNCALLPLLPSCV